MKPTRAINVTGNPNWRYRPAAKTCVADTIRREQKRLADAERREAESLDRIAKRRIGGA